MDRGQNKYKFTVTWEIPVYVSFLPSLRAISPIKKGCATQVTFTKRVPHALVCHEQQYKGHEPTSKQPIDILKLQAMVRK